MSDVFISYARSREEQAKQVEAALGAIGHSVWRDAELPAHRTYADVIEERLKSAKAVVVLWSADAAKSQWVRAEADAARELGTLVQASVDGTTPPMPFNQIQCADLKGWGGEGDHPGWRKLKGSVAALAGRSDEPEKPPKPRRQMRSICVLPFANMSGDAEQEYFSDGISEDITTDLSKVSALEVIARNTAFMFKGQSVDVAEIARKLNVSHVLEGSVRKAGNRVRITAQLIDGSTGGHLWADRYDRDLDDIFAIQDEISKAIVEALKVKLLPEEKKAIENRGTTSADAYNLYLMARQFWITGNHGDFRREERVVRLCQRAIEIDSDYAQPWALMAIGQSNLRFGFGRPGDDGVAAAKRALSIDPSVVDAYRVTARKLMEEGHLEAAVAEIKAALRVDPDSWEINKAAGFLLLKQSKVAEAAAHYERAVSQVESDYDAWGMLLSCYRALGDDRNRQRAAKMTLEQAQDVLDLDPSNGAAMSLAVRALLVLGDADRATEWMDRALLLDPDNLEMRYNFAGTLAAELNDREGALALLESSLSQAKGAIGRAETDPDFERLRDDPRFKAIIADAQARRAKANQKSGVALA